MDKLLLIFMTLFLGCSMNADSPGAGEIPDGAPSRTAAPAAVTLVIPKAVDGNPYFEQMTDGLMRAEREFGLKARVVEAGNDGEIEEILRDAVLAGTDLVIAASFESEDDLRKVAADYPDRAFAIIDGVVDMPNVRSVVFRDEEASYLLGAAAGLITKSHIVGIVGVDDIPLIRARAGGFEAGLMRTNPQATLLIDYVGSFADPDRAKALALQQHAAGADFIAAISALGDPGVFAAAKEQGFYTAGQDIDYTAADPRHILLSQLKDTGFAVHRTIRDFISGAEQGDFRFGIVEYGLKDGAVDLVYVDEIRRLIGREGMNLLQELKEEAAAGRIVLPERE